MELSEYSIKYRIRGKKHGGKPAMPYVWETETLS